MLRKVNEPDEDSTVYKHLRIRAIRRKPYDLGRLARALLELTDLLHEERSGQEEPKSTAGARND